MHHVRRWAHDTAHRSRYNPWYNLPRVVGPPDQFRSATRSPFTHPPNTDIEKGPSSANAPDTIGRKWKVSMLCRIWCNAKYALLHSWVNVLLVFVPAGIAVHFAGINPNVVFALNAIAIIPLAGLLTHATECVAHRLGPTLGALLNVSFGNAVELIIFIALAKNEIRIVQASLIGSILANLLLILGMAFLIGGLEFQEQIYDSTVTQTSACLLALSVLSLLIPTAFHASFNSVQLADAAVLKVSRGTSVILLITYILYLLFQLKSHSYLYQGTPQHIIDEQAQPGVLARFDSTSSKSSSATSTSVRARSSSSGSNRKIKKHMRAKLGRKRHTKTEFSEEPEEITEMDEKARHVVDLDSPPSSELRSTSAPKTEAMKMSIVASHDQEHKGRIAGPARPPSQNNRPQIYAHSSNPVIISVDQATTNPVVAANRPAALRAFSNFRPPPVFRSPTFAPSHASTHPLPQNQLRRLALTNQALAHRSTGPPTKPTQNTNESQSSQPSNDSDTPSMSQTASIILLLCSTGLVALCAEFLVASIEHLVESSPLSEAFIGLIILPIVGNAAEHVTAVTVAAKNKLDLALGVALGSSIQIALFVTPVIVILGWILDKSMSLYFNLFEVASLFVSTFVVNFLVLDGRSNYLEGALLCACYIILAVGAYFFPDGQAQSSLGSGSGGSS